MLQIADLRYYTYLVTEKGKKYNISHFIESLGWEENENELAVRLSITAKNEKTSAGNLSSLAKLGCMVIVIAECGTKKEEVARGYIVDWKPSVSSSKKTFDCTCYDELYNLQESQDNIYYSKGISTKSAITKILKNWSIPLGAYHGPDVKHAKLVYKTEKLSDVLLDILDDAKKKGGDACVIRANKGKIFIIPKGDNKNIYHFGSLNTKLVSHKLSTSGMVTRVKVIGKEDKNEKSSVIVTVDGKKEYGIRQEIHVRSEDDDHSKAKKAAEKILKEKGKVKSEITFQAPDIPFLRRGDLVHITVGTLNGYYLVEGVRHNADGREMDLNIKKWNK